MIDGERNELKSDKLEKKEGEYKYGFNLGEIDCESFGMEIFRKYGKEVFEEDEV
ncbi:hypothetical protein [Staphylococcus epidermidis]|uniref:hypothetical protein n=1 Tax=Staphylococcus epidermidis TaxID=1282 RepID=UPI00164318C8|nr:hypothetical protein [Staphylococcus epidermidis]